MSAYIVFLLKIFNRFPINYLHRISLAEPLRVHLQELRKDRADLEKVRDEVIKRLKSIHNRITLRRKESTIYF